MNYLKTFENFTASTPVSKGEQIENEKAKREAETVEKEENLKELEEELEEETEKEDAPKKKII